MKFPGTFLLIIFTKGFLPFVLTKNLTAENEVLRTGLLWASPFECWEDSYCDYCSHLPVDVCITPFGQLEDFCLFCRTDTPLHTCPFGFCACGLSAFNTEWCDPWDADEDWYCDDKYCVDLVECGKCDNVQKHSEKLHRAENKRIINEEIQEAQILLKALEQ